jgi:hypothetical protein
MQHAQKLLSLHGGEEEAKADVGGQNRYVESIKLDPLYHM